MEFDDAAFANLSSLLSASYNMVNSRILRCSANQSGIWSELTMRFITQILQTHFLCHPKIVIMYKCMIYRLGQAQNYIDIVQFNLYFVGL